VSSIGINDLRNENGNGRKKLKNLKEILLIKYMEKIIIVPVNKKLKM